MVEILNEAHVVPAQSNEGLVRVSGSEYKAKQLHSGFSHFRLRLNNVATAEVTEDNGKEVTKNLYMATKLTNE